jgi:hypothetical protein
MTQQTPDADTGSSDGSTSGGTPDPALKGAGLSATGKTADQFSPGDDAPGTTYGGSAGTGTEEREVVGADEDAEVGQTAEGDVEGA